MKILLIDFDGKLPNLALMKLSTWYKQHGYEVFLNYCDNPDLVHISTLFTWNRPKVEELLKQYPHAFIGGTGWDLNKILAKAVEACKPDYGLYTANDIYDRIKGRIGKCRRNKQSNKNGLERTNPK